MKTRNTLSFTELTAYAPLSVALRDAEDHLIVEIKQSEDVIWVRLEDFDEMLKHINEWWAQVPA